VLRTRSSEQSGSREGLIESLVDRDPFDSGPVY
jgi:hypothetical protein